MAVYHSLELRWFFPGDPPGDFFERFAGSRVAAVRTDVYLTSFARGTLGVKVREGAIEIKRRTAALGALHLGQSGSGRLERWTKWSHRLDAGDISGERSDPTLWRSLEKARVLRRFSCELPEPVEVGHSARLSVGSGVEITRLRLDNAQWWTFGLEAFAPTDDLSAITRTIRFLAERDLIPRVPFAASRGYPAWLCGEIGRTAKKEPQPDDKT